MSVGWIIVSLFTFMIALSMAEIVSAIPTAGGMSALALECLVSD